MKVVPSLGFEHYQRAVSAAKSGENAAKIQPENRVQPPESANTDKVTISGEAAARAELSRLATSISAEVDNYATGRIAQLKSAVQAGEYQVSTAALANAILGTEE